MDDRDRLSELEDRLAELKARMPAHSVRPTMLMEMEELEEEIDEVRARLRGRSESDA